HREDRRDERRDERRERRYRFFDFRAATFRFFFTGARLFAGARFFFFGGTTIDSSGYGWPMTSVIASTMRASALFFLRLLMSPPIGPSSPCARAGWAASRSSGTCRGSLSMRRVRRAAPSTRRAAPGS